MNREIADLREVIQKLVPMLTGKGLRVTQQGSRAYVSANARTNKPEVVNIPSIPDNASSDFIAAISGFIDHEVGHVLFTDWKYYGGDGVKVDKFSPEGKALVNSHNIVEDTFVEREIVKTFPGSKKNLAQLHEHFLKKITQPALDQVKGDEKQEFGVLFVPMVRALSGQQIFQDFMDQGDHWNHPMINNIHLALSDEAMEMIKNARNTQETLAAAQEIHDILFNRKEEPEQQEPEQPQPQQPQQGQNDQQNEQDGQQQGDADENKGQSQDKPEKKAGKGNGDGERDHSEQEASDDAGDASDDDGSDDASGSEGGEKSSDDDAGEQSEESAGSGGAEDEGDDDAEGSGDGDSEDDGAGAEDDEDGVGDGDDGDEDPAGDDTDGDVAVDDSVDNDGADDNGDGSDEELDEYEDIEGGGSDEDADPNTDTQSGAGGDAGKSMFDLDPSEFEPVDLSSAISKQISEMAQQAIKESDYSAFTKDDDRIEKFDPDQLGIKMRDNWVPDMEERLQGMVGRMQKDIERMMASQAHVIRTPGHTRGRLHSPSLHRVMNNDPRVFTQKEEIRSKDTAVTLLIDNSGSMRGLELSVAMHAAYGLASTLERVNIPNEVMGFTTAGLSNGAERALRQDPMAYSFSRQCAIVMPIFKEFRERITPEVKRRFAAQINQQVGCNTNVDGESLEYAALRMMGRSEKRKVILVLSDGLPVGSGTGAHLSNTVAKLGKMGVETVGIGICTDVVKRFYPRYLVLNDVEDLPSVVMGELRRILTS